MSFLNVKLKGSMNGFEWKNYLKEQEKEHFEILFIKKP